MPKIKDLMTPNPEVIRPNTSLFEAAKKMRDLDVGVMPICDGDRLVGMLTDRDITIRATADGLDPKSTHASTVMTPGMAYCYEDQDVNDAARVMKECQIRRLPIVNRDHRLVGIVSLGDVAVEANNDRLSGDVLEKVSEPAQPDR